MRQYSRLTTKTRNIARVCDMLDACGWVDTDPAPDPAVELPYWTQRLKPVRPPDGYITAVGLRYDPHTQPDTLFIIVDDSAYGSAAIPRSPNTIYIPRGDDTQILDSLRDLLMHWAAALRAADERRMVEAARYATINDTLARKQARKCEKDAITSLQASSNRSPAEQDMLDRMLDKAAHRRQRGAESRKQARKCEKDAITSLQASSNRSPAEQTRLDRLLDKAARRRQQSKEATRRYRLRTKEPE